MNHPGPSKSLFSEKLNPVGLLAFGFGS